jgi:hypothetical protein
MLFINVQFLSFLQNFFLFMIQLLNHFKLLLHLLIKYSSYRGKLVISIWSRGLSGLHWVMITNSIEIESVLLIVEIENSIVICSIYMIRIFSLQTLVLNLVFKVFEFWLSLLYPVIEFVL